MLVVSDTSPSNYLVLLQQETLLQVLYGHVVIPPAIYSELQRSSTPEDDSEGREEAERRALKVTGTIGVLETAAIRGLIDLPPVLAQLQVTTFYASQRLYAEVLARDATRKSRPIN